MTEVATQKNCDDIINERENADLTRCENKTAVSSISTSTSEIFYPESNIDEFVEDFEAVLVKTATLSDVSNLNENVEALSFEDKATNPMVMENQSNAAVEGKYENVLSSMCQDSLFDVIIRKANNVEEENQVNGDVILVDNNVPNVDTSKKDTLENVSEVDNEVENRDTSCEHSSAVSSRNVIIDYIMDYIIDRTIQLCRDDEKSSTLFSESWIDIAAESIARILSNLKAEIESPALEEDEKLLSSKSEKKDTSIIKKTNELTDDINRKIRNIIAAKLGMKDTLTVENSEMDIPDLNRIGIVLLSSKTIVNDTITRITEKINASVTNKSENLVNNSGETTIKNKCTDNVSENIKESSLEVQEIEVKADTNAREAGDIISTTPLPENKKESEVLSSCTICSEKTSSDRVSSNPRNSEDDFTPPDDELCEKIIRQVEYCFSDFNIMKDSFLLKHVRRNKEGFVSLKLVASFRKVKSLTKDWRVVAHCVEKSTKLRINEEKNKVCRVDPIPDYKDTPFAKTVVVFHLPFAKPTAENVTELFSKFGTVVSAQILFLGNDIDNPFAKRCLAFHNDNASPIYAMIEFKEYDDAMDAIHDEHGYLAKENGLKVVPLLSQAYKNRTRNQKPQDRKKRRGREKTKGDFLPKSQKDSASSDERLGIDRSKVTSPEGNNLKSVLTNGYKTNSPRRYSRPKKQVMSPNNSSNQKEHIILEHSYSNDGDGAQKHPWKPRRQLNGNGNVGMSGSSVGPMIKARQPIGPDGTRGFHTSKHFENPLSILKYTT